MQLPPQVLQPLFQQPFQSQLPFQLSLFHVPLFQQLLFPQPLFQQPVPQRLQQRLQQRLAWQHCCTGTKLLESSGAMKRVLRLQLLQPVIAPSALPFLVSDTLTKLLIPRHSFMNPRLFWNNRNAEGGHASDHSVGSSKVCDAPSSCASRSTCSSRSSS